MPSKRPTPRTGTICAVKPFGPSPSEQPPPPVVTRRSVAGGLGVPAPGVPAPGVGVRVPDGVPPPPGVWVAPPPGVWVPLGVGVPFGQGIELLRGTVTVVAPGTWMSAVLQNP